MSSQLYLAHQDGFVCGIFDHVPKITNLDFVPISFPFSNLPKSKKVFLAEQDKEEDHPVLYREGKAHVPIDGTHYVFVSTKEEAYLLQLWDYEIAKFEVNFIYFSDQDIEWWNPTLTHERIEHLEFFSTNHREFHVKQIFLLIQRCLPHHLGNIVESYLLPDVQGMNQSMQKDMIHYIRSVPLTFTEKIQRKFMTL